MSGIVEELVDVGILVHGDPVGTTGGRPARTVRLDPLARLALGMTLLDESLHVALTDLEGHPLRSLEIPMTATTADAMLNCMQTAADEILTAVDRRLVLGVGAGSPGIVNLDTGVIEISTSHHWLTGEIRLKDRLEEALGLPVYVANRSRVAAIGELAVGVGRGFSHLSYLFLGRGIAAANISDGRLFSGSSHGAGEIGHVSLVPDGPLCGCGNHGCLDVYASRDALLARARAAARSSRGTLLQLAVDDHLERLTLDHLLDAARQNDPAARRVMDEAGAKIGTAVGILINLFNPEMVVIGGPTGCAAGDLLLEPVCREARLRTAPTLLARTRIVAGTPDLLVQAIGAAMLAIDLAPVECFFDGNRARGVSSVFPSPLAGVNIGGG